MSATAKMIAMLAVLCMAVPLLGSSPSPPARGRMVIASSAGMGWTNVTQAVSPPGVGGGMMAYDSRANRFVAFGGSDGDPTNGTWILDPATMAWTPMHPALSPPARVDGAFVYDERADAFVLFGGWHEPADEVYTRFGDTWVYYLGNDTWVPTPTAHAPVPRSDAAIAYDPRDDVLLLYGGFNGTTYLGDAWRYRFASSDWSLISGPTVPSHRADGRIVYDGSTNAFYLFGGNDYSGPNRTFHHLNDTWSFDPVHLSWAELFPRHNPGALDYAVFAADPSAGELLSLGGYGNSVVLGTLWAFNTTDRDWRNLTYPGGPSPRMAAVGGYSPVENVFVVFSGGDTESIKNDTWAYHFPGPLMGRITASTASPDVGAGVSFQGDVFGGSGVFENLAWDFGDGARASGAATSHAFSSPGTYTVRFQAYDDLGASTNATLLVTVGGGFLPVIGGLVVVGSAAAIIAGLAYRRSRRKAPPSMPP